MKVSLISLGCPKNQVAAEQMLAALAAAGHEITPDPAEAEAVVVNTCAFIEDAKQEAIDTLLEAAQLKGGRLKTLLCAGCLAQLYGGEVMAELPEVDGVVGVGSCERIAEALESRRARRKARLSGPQRRARAGVRAAGLHRPGLGLPADRRGLRQPLFLLPHPLHPRALPLAPHGRHRRGGEVPRRAGL